MSTRATYEFSNASDMDNLTVCFYIHMDGYPQGAAAYFYAMNDPTIDACYIDYAGQFFRANEAASFIRDRDEYSVTEYHYSLKRDGTLTAYKRDTDIFWEAFFEGDWLDFVNKFQEESRKLYRFYICSRYKRIRIMTLKDATQWIERQHKQVSKLDDMGRSEEASNLRVNIGCLKGQIGLIEDARKCFS